MKIIHQNAQRIQARFNPVFIQAFLGLFLAIGCIDALRLLIGQNVDLYGTFIFIALPLGVWHFLIARVTLDLDSQQLKVTSRYLLRTTTACFERSEIERFLIEGHKGNHMGGTYSLLIELKNEQKALISGFRSLGNTRSRHTVQELNKYIQS